MKVFKRIAMIFTTMLLVVTLSGCNTIEGAGQDIEEGGEAIEDAAN